MPITSIIEQQVPEFIRHDTDGHHFLTFLEYYYKFLSKSWDIEIEDIKDASIELLQNETENSLISEKGGIYQQLISLKEMRDIDTAPVSLVSNFVSEYMDGVNAPTLDSIRNNMRLMKNFYENKGNENSFHFLFTLLYDEVINISYPFDKVLKLSENEWVKYDFLRVEETAGLNALLAESIGNTISGNGATGILDSYTRYVVYGNQDKPYYKLILRDFEIGEIQPSTVTGIGNTPLTVMPGLGDVNFSLDSSGTSIDVANIYPSDRIKIENVISEPQFGASLIIDKMKSMTMDEATITTDKNGYIKFVNDYFTTYEIDIGVNPYRLVGKRSGATAIIRDVDSKHRYWVENIIGTFLTDYQLDEKGGSELVDIYDSIGTKIGNLRLGRLYTACDMTAVVKVENDGTTKTIINKGKNYKFNPRGYIIDNGVYNMVSITGLGKIEKIEIREMGYEYKESNRYKIKVDGVEIGSGIWKSVGKEEYYKSILNTLDGEAKLRDSNYYQEFSYEIFSKTSMSMWKNPVKKLLHPAGMELFGKEDYVSSPFDLSLTDPKQFYLSELGIEPVPIENMTFEVFSAMVMNFTPDTWNSSGFGSVFTLPQISNPSLPVVSTTIANLQTSVPVYDDSNSKIYFNFFNMGMSTLEAESLEILHKNGTLYRENFINEFKETSFGLDSISNPMYELIKFSDTPDFRIFTEDPDNNSFSNYNLRKMDMSERIEYEDIDPNNNKTGNSTIYSFSDFSNTSVLGIGNNFDSLGSKKVFFSDSWSPGESGQGSGIENIGSNKLIIEDIMKIDQSGVGDGSGGIHAWKNIMSDTFIPTIIDDPSPPVITYRNTVHTTTNYPDGIYSSHLSEMI